jgi:hypothetical protein
LRSVWFEQPEPVQDKLKQLVCSLSAPISKRLGWDYPENESFNDTSLRTLMVGVAGKTGDPYTVAEARRRFELFVNGDQNAVHPNLRATLFAIVLANGGEAEFDKIVSIYRNTTLPDQKISALTSLGNAKQPELLLRFLEYGMSEEVRSQDVPFVFSNVASNLKGRYIAWQFLQDNWKTIYDRFVSGSFLFGRIISSVTGNFSSEEKAQEAENFFKRFPKADLASVDREILQAIEKIRSNAKWVQRDAADTAKWSMQNVN